MTTQCISLFVLCVCVLKGKSDVKDTEFNFMYIELEASVSNEPRSPATFNNCLDNITVP